MGIENNKITIKDISYLMNNLEFRKLYRTYFNSWSEIQNVIFFMHLYETLDTYLNILHFKMDDKLTILTLLFAEMNNNVFG